MKRENARVLASLQYFRDSTDEEIIIWQRTHWILPAYASFVTICIAIIFFLGLIFLPEQVIVSSLLRIALEYLIIAIGVITISKIVVDWYFHFYLVTTEKILEVQYSPFFSYKTNCVLLKQVNITEIDDRKFGIWRELFDYGDITVTFDRPTHEEEFTFKDIPHPANVGLQLRTYFSTASIGTTQQIWYSPKLRRGSFIKRISTSIMKGGE